jgi:hypothetical protein
MTPAEAVGLQGKGSSRPEETTQKPVFGREPQGLIRTLFLGGKYMEFSVLRQ